MVPFAAGRVTSAVVNFPSDQKYHGRHGKSFLTRRPAGDEKPYRGGASWREGFNDLRAFEILSTSSRFPLASWAASSRDSSVCSLIRFSMYFWAVMKRGGNGGGYFVLLAWISSNRKARA
jgi:hypothetical protein